MRARIARTPFDRTYEGLKLFFVASLLISFGAFDRTYEGLKLAHLRR